MRRLPKQKQDVKFAKHSRLTAMTAELSASAADDSVVRAARVCGVVVVLSFLALIPLSYALAPFSPRLAVQPREVELLQRLADAIPGLSMEATGRLYAVVEGKSFLANPLARALALGLPLLMASVSSLYLMNRVRQAREHLNGTVPETLFKVAVMLAALCTLRYPIFTQDFWLSVVWGRMVAEGDNPYTMAYTPGSLQGLPLEDFGQRMTYGPLWALISGAFAWVSGRQVLIEFLLWKIVNAACWIGTLWMVRRIAAQVSGRHEAMAICLFGWLPISVSQAVAEGHNDIVMVAGAVAWLYLVLQQRHVLSVVALTLSSVVKYVTAPLFLVEFAMARLAVKLPTRKYVATIVVCAVGALLLFLPFATDQSIFASAARMRHWKFWTPATMMVDLAERAGVGIPYALAQALIASALLATVVVYLNRQLREPSVRCLASVTLGVLSLVLFTSVGHVWPWFILWVLPFAALAWESALGCFVISMALLAPFLGLDWLLSTDRHLVPTLGIWLYSGAGAISLVMALQMRTQRSAYPAALNV